jgi:hypothetical protein
MPPKARRRSPASHPRKGRKRNMRAEWGRGVGKSVEEEEENKWKIKI